MTPPNAGPDVETLVHIKEHEVKHTAGMTLQGIILSGKADLRHTDCVHLFRNILEMIQL